MKGYCALAMEAATSQLSIAACQAGRTVSLKIQPARDETQRIYQHGERLLTELGAAYSMLDFVAFGCGPGSFTGVRIVAAAAQAIAFARSIPVCRISTLAVMAAGAAQLLDAKLVGVCLDARIHRAYFAMYRVGEGSAVLPVWADGLIDPAEFAVPGAEKFAAVGDGWAAYPDFLERHVHRAGIVATDLLPSSLDLLKLASAEFEAGRTVDARDALPEYLGQGFGRNSGRL